MAAYKDRATPWADTNSYNKSWKNNQYTWLVTSAAVNYALFKLKLISSRIFELYL